METVINMIGAVGTGIGVLAIVLLCMLAVVLSAVSISGTWVILGAAVIALAIRGDSAFPGWMTMCLFLVLSVAVEVAEAVAASWGVSRRGGSRLGGSAALVGGIVGLFAGGIIPVPVLGPLLGMMVLSFAATFLVEQRRLKHVEHAAHIARGAVWARVLVIVLKVAVTVGMGGFLLIGMAISRSG